MMGYLIFIEADDALQEGKLSDPTYKKANAHACGTILMWTDISLHHLLVTCRGVGHAWQYNPFSSVVVVGYSVGDHHNLAAK